MHTSVDIQLKGYTQVKEDKKSLAFNIMFAESIVSGLQITSIKLGNQYLQSF